MIFKLLATALLSTPVHAAVETIEEAIDAVGGNHGVNFASDDAGSITLAIMDAIVPLVNIVAVLIIVIAGLILIISQDEGQLAKAQKTVIAAVASLVLINVAPSVYNAFTTGFESGGGAAGGAGILSLEVIGFLNFIEVPLVLIAMITIIVSGIRSILTFGSDQGAAQIRKTVLAVVAGVVIIVGKLIITAATGATLEDASGITDGFNRADRLAQLVADLLRILLSYMGLAALIVVVIAGIYMVVNKGDQEVVSKTRNLILRVVIGLIVIMVSVGLITVFTPSLFGGGG